MSTVKKTKGTGKKPVKAPKAAVAATLKADSATSNGNAADNLHIDSNGQTPGVRRRDFIHIATVSFAGVGAAAVAMPLVSQMSASADVLALASIEVDVAAIQPGQSIKTSWRKQPVFIRNLTPAEIEEANKVDVGGLRGLRTFGRGSWRS